MNLNHPAIESGPLTAADLAAHNAAHPPLSMIPDDDYPEPHMPPPTVVPCSTAVRLFLQPRRFWRG